MAFHRDILRINVEAEAERISQFIREMTLKNFKRRGAVIGLSGGVDSAVTLKIAVQALGKKNVHAFLLPHKDFSSKENLILS